MTIKERINALLMKYEEAVAPAPVIELAEYTTVDGTVVKCSGELAEGAALTVMGAEGEGPAPDGVYELDNGKILTVSGGVIGKIEEKEGEPTAEYALKADFDTATIKLNDEIKNLTALVTTLSESLKTLGGQQKEALQLMQEFAAIEPNPTTPLPNQTTDAKSERLKSIAESLKNLKNK